VPGVIKKLWLWPTLALALAVLGNVLNYNSNWNFVIALASLFGVMATARLLATKKTADGSHLANGNKIFLFMSLLQAALMAGAFFAGSYISASLLFVLVVWFSSMYLWGCDVNQRVAVRKAAGES
jgi:hypothetical protein